MADILSQYDEIIQRKAKQYGVDPRVVKAVIMQESSGNSKASSPRGAQGLMQLMPDTAKGLGIKDSFDPEQNIDGGVRYLKQQIDKFGLEGGLAAYNAGPGNVQKYKGVPPFQETQNYVKKIMGNLGGVNNGALTNSPSSVNFQNIQKTFGSEKKNETVESRFSQLFKKLYNPNPSVLDEPSLAKKASDAIFNPIFDKINQSPNFQKFMDQWMLDPRTGQVKPWQDVPAIPPQLADPIGEAVFNSVAPPIAAYNSLIGKKSDVQKGVEQSLSETVQGFTTPKGLGIGAAMTVPVVGPYIGAAMTPMAVKGAYESGKESINSLKAGDTVGAAKNATNALINMGMAAAGAGMGYKQLKGDIPKVVDAYKENPILNSETGAIRLRNMPPVPEKIATLKLQTQALSEGKVPAVLVTEGAAQVIQNRLDEGGKVRGFVTTVKESPVSPKPLAEGVSGTYDPIKNMETMARAQALVKENHIKARDNLFSKKQPTAEDYAVGMELIRQNNAKGDFSESIRIAEEMARKATTQGQAIQALSMYNRLGPDGILRVAAKTVEDARAKLPPVKQKILDNTAKELSKKNGLPAAEMMNEAASKLGLPSFTPEFANKISEQARQIEQMPEGRAKAIATATMLRDIAEIVPPSLGRKISTFQTIAQLLNPKTGIRNVLGNAAFAVAENVKDIVGAPLDKAASLFTGERTKSLNGGNQIREQISGFSRGLKQGVQEAIKGVDVTQVGDKWEVGGISNGLPRGRTFKKGILGGAEKLMNISLKAPDRAFYEAAKSKSLSEQMSIAGVKQATPEMFAKAELEALYKTFQDDSVPARIFSGIKKSLNVGKDFGAGDILLKYPKTPGNILARSIDYSPAGFIKGTVELAKAATDNGFDQKAFVDSTSRAIVGTAGVTAVGYGLSQLGLLRNTAARDPDLRAVERSAGLNQSQLNISGLTRYVLSGFDKNEAALKPGDKLVTYDWAVPLSVPLSMGARAEEKSKELSSNVDKTKDFFATAAAGIEGGLETLGDQPLIKTFTQLAQGKTLPKSLIEAAKGIPASFTPTLLKQFNDLFDNTARDTKDRNPLIMAGNLALGKTPFARELPIRRDPFGNPVEKYQEGTNSLMNVFFNPSFISKFKPTPETKIVLDLYKNTNDARIVPIVVEDKFKFNGIPIEITARQRSNMQKWVGERVKNYFSKLAQNGDFINLPDEQKVKLLSGYLSDVRSAARAGIFMDIVNQQPPNLRQAYAVQQFQKHKLGGDQIKNLFKNLAEFQMMNK